MTKIWWAAILIIIFGLSAFLKKKLTASKQLDRLLQLVAEGKKPAQAAHEIIRRLHTTSALFDIARLCIVIVIGTVAVSPVARFIGRILFPLTHDMEIPAGAWVTSVIVILGCIIGIDALFRAGSHSRGINEESLNFLTGEQLAFLALQSYRDGDTPGAIRRELLTGFFDFADKRVDKIMIPKNRMVSLPATLRVREAIDALHHTGLARFPVFDREEERVIGIVYFTDLLDATAKGSTVQVADLVSAPVLLKPYMTATEAVKELRLRKAHLGIVADDNGRCIGLVGLGDLLDEIVTNKDRRMNKKSMKKIAPGVVEADGHTIVAEVIRELGIDIDDFVPNTVGAYVFERLGRVPRVGDAIDAGDMVIDVLEVTGAEATRVRATKNRLLNL